MEDVRAQLKRSDTVPETFREKTNFAVLHWNGSSVFYNSQYPGDINILKADARWHVNNNGWDGLAYHYAAGRSGKEYQCRTWTARLSHSGNTLMNNEAFSILCITGDGDPISDLQYKSVLNRLRSTGINRRYWLGHKESPRTTSCPGALLIRWLDNLRKEVKIQVSTKALYLGTIRDEPSILSYKLGQVEANQPVTGHWVLGQPIKGDSLWLMLSGDRYIHASSLDSRSYNYVG